MKIYLLEDNSIQMGRLEDAVAHELMTFGKDLSCVQSFDKPDQLLSAITSNTSDQIFFLDIEIKGEDKKGLDIAKIIRQNNPYAIIAFVTTHIEFMPQAFGITAYKYINKTLDGASFRKEIGETIAQVFPINATTTDEFFLYKTESQLINLPMDQILYLSTSDIKHHVHLQTIHTLMDIRANLADFKKIHKKLYPCHRSYIVNTDMIISVNLTNYEATLINGQVLPVSRMKIGKIAQIVEERGRGC